MNLTDAQLDAAYEKARIAADKHLAQLNFQVSAVEANAIFVRKVFEFAEWFRASSAAPVAADGRRVGDDHLSGEVYWRYTEPAPRGVKLALLTKGKTQTTGEWQDGQGCIAWSLLIPRDKALEEELGL